MRVITVARKPLAGTVAKNTLEWGAGGINVDASRIKYDDPSDKPKACFGGRKGEKHGSKYGHSDDYWSNVSDEGRWPPNVVLTVGTSRFFKQVGVKPATDSE